MAVKFEAPSVIVCGEHMLSLGTQFPQSISASRARQCIKRGWVAVVLLLLLLDSGSNALHDKSTPLDICTRRRVYHQTTTGIKNIHSKPSDLPDMILLLLFGRKKGRQGATWYSPLLEDLFTQTVVFKK